MLRDSSVSDSYSLIAVVYLICPIRRKRLRIPAEVSLVKRSGFEAMDVLSCECSWLIHKKKICNKNDTFKQVIGILANWHISTGILTRIARYHFISWIFTTDIFHTWTRILKTTISLWQFQAYDYLSCGHIWWPVIDILVFNLRCCTKKNHRTVP